MSLEIDFRFQNPKQLLIFKYLKPYFPVALSNCQQIADIAAFAFPVCGESREQESSHDPSSLQKIEPVGVYP